MAIEKKVHLYEVLLRFNADGFQGAHVKDLERVSDSETGEVYSERETDPRAVTLEECGPIIGESCAGLIAENDRLKIALAEAEASGEAARTGLAITQERLDKVAKIASE